MKTFRLITHTEQILSEQCSPPLLSLSLTDQCHDSRELGQFLFIPCFLIIRACLRTHSFRIRSDVLLQNWVTEYFNKWELRHRVTLWAPSRSQNCRNVKKNLFFSHFILWSHSGPHVSSFPGREITVTDWIIQRSRVSPVYHSTQYIVHSTQYSWSFHYYHKSGIRTISVWSCQLSDACQGSA